MVPLASPAPSAPPNTHVLNIEIRLGKDKKGDTMLLGRERDVVDPDVERAHRQKLNFDEDGRVEHGTAAVLRVDHLGKGYEVVGPVRRQGTRGDVAVVVDQGVARMDAER